MQQLMRIMTTERLRPAGRRQGQRRYTRHAEKLLEFFALHRVALAGQVERQFEHFLYSDRTTRLHLRTLVEAGDLVVMRCRGVGQPNVYRMTEQGMRKATAGERVDLSPRPSRPRSVLGNHLLHELLITEFAVAAGTTIERRADLKLLWEERFGFVGQPAFAGLIPDYAFLFRHGQGMLICLVEVSSGEESPTRLGEKLQHYSAWAGTSLGQSFLTETYRRFGAQAARPLRHRHHAGSAIDSPP